MENTGLLLLLCTYLSVCLFPLDTRSRLDLEVKPVHFYKRPPCPSLKGYIFIHSIQALLIKTSPIDYDELY